MYSVARAFSANEMMFCSTFFPKKEIMVALNHIIDVAGQAATIMNGSINSKKREFLKSILSNGVLTDKSACFYLKKPSTNCFLRRVVNCGSR